MGQSPEPAKVNAARSVDVPKRRYVDDLVANAIDLDDPLIPEDEVARILRISVRTLQRLRKARKIAYVTIRRTVLFRKSAIERFLQRCTVSER
jgi:excisionase family DNA binding protein